MLNENYSSEEFEELSSEETSEENGENTTNENEGLSVPEDETERQKLLGIIENDLTSLDIESYNADTYSFCYRYLMKNKKYFLM